MPESIVIIKDNNKEYRTSQLALCPYLELYGVDRGVNFMRAEVIKDNKGKLKIEFIFSDPNSVCKDLELEFRHSSECKYRNLLFFYKKLISDKLGMI